MTSEATVAAAIAGTPLAAVLVAPERLLSAPQARLVKDHRRTAVAAISIEGREIFVKRFKPYVWYRRLEAAIVATPARRCWQAAKELESAGFAVAPALAIIETRRCSIPEDSYFITDAVPGAEPGGRFWLGECLAPPERRRLLLAAAAYLRRLHDGGFYSRDANADNFLVRASPAGRLEFFLIDLENVRRLRGVSRRRRVKNLVQLARPIRASVRRVDQVRFVRAYLGGSRDALAAWLAELGRLDAKKEAEYRRRASGS